MWHYVISAVPFVSRYASADETLCSGKWVVPFPLGDPDGLWERLVRAACRGEVRATKRSSERLDAIVGHHLACVYCEASDPETVSATLRVLRDLGVSGPLLYKSDKATVEGRDVHLWASEDLEAAGPAADEPRP